MQHSRFYTLDALRGVAAICVLVHHLRDGASCHNGYLAVDFFFQLSGFVVALAYQDKLANGTMSLSGFAAARFVRLYPMIFMGAVIGSIFTPIRSEASASSIVLAFLCLPTFSAEAVFPINGPFWSLFFELFANAVFAVAIVHAAGRRTLTATIFLSLVAFCAAAFYFGKFNVGYSPKNFLAGFPRVGFSFALGVALYHVSRAVSIPKTHPALWSALLLGVLAWPFGARTLSLFCIAGLFPAIILFASNAEPSGRLRWIAERLGDLSYPLYATHFPILMTAVYLAGRFGIAKDDPIFLSTLCLALVALSLGFVRYWDVPMRRILRKWLCERKAAIKQSLGGDGL